MTRETGAASGKSPVSSTRGAVAILATALVLLFGLRLVQGFYANLRYEKQYLGWRADRAGTASGLSWVRAGLGALLWLAIVPLTLYRFTVGKIAPGLEPWVAYFPVEKKSYYAPVSTWMDGGFDWLSVKGAGVFDGVVATIRAVLDGLETVFVDAPWPVVMTVIVVVAWRLAGPRVAIFTAAALACLALFGLWETSMVTVSLLGAALGSCRTESHSLDSAEEPALTRLSSGLAVIPDRRLLGHPQGHTILLACQSGAEIPKSNRTQVLRQIEDERESKSGSFAFQRLLPGNVSG